MKELELQRSVIDLAHLNRWRVAHFRSVPVHRPNGKVVYMTPVQADGVGFPDLVLVRGHRALFWELKSDTGRLAPDQARWLHDLELAGLSVSVIRPDDWRSGCIEESLR